MISGCPGENGYSPTYVPDLVSLHKFDIMVFILILFVPFYLYFADDIIDECYTYLGPTGRMPQE